MNSNIIKLENNDKEIKYEDIFKNSEEIKIKREPVEPNKSLDLNDTEINGNDNKNILIKDEYGAEMLQIKDATIENADFSEIESKIFIKDNKGAIEDINSLVEPQLNNKLESENHNLFNCPQCPFRTKYKTCIKRHTLRHKKPEECTTYFCDMCKFKTIHIVSLKNHLSTDRHLYRQWKTDSHNKIKKNLVHIIEPDKKPLTPGFLTVAIDLLSCELCPYQTRSKMNYKKHLFTHKNTSECTIFKCDVCSYETKRKNCMTNHLLTHKKLEDIDKIFNCDLCDYKSKYLSCMSTHKLTHKDVKEVKMFKCKKCSYQAKYKKSLNRHIRYTKCALKLSATDTMEDIINSVALNIKTNVLESRP